MKPIEKIQLGSSAINVLATSLSHTHHQIATIQDRPEHIEELLNHQDEQLKKTAEKLIECANDLADYMNGTDAIDEELTEMVNPIFELINKDPLEEI